VDRISPATGSEIIIDGFGGGGLSSVQYFTSSGTWTKTSGVTKIIVEVQGAGGGGARSSSSHTNQTGGGSGAYANKFINVSSISTATITVGAGGASQTGNAVGNDGGDSIYSDGTNTITAEGGSGGLLSGNDSPTKALATGGDLNINGATPTPYSGGNYSTSGVPSFYGPAVGSKVWINNNGGSNRPRPQGYGSSGGGGDHTGTNDNGEGQAGTDGIVIVTEYK
jgi:hypothetical protein